MNIKKNRTGKLHSLSRIISAVVVTLILFGSMMQEASSKTLFEDRLYRQVVDSFEMVSCLTPEEFNYHKDLIKILGYTNLLVFKTFCSIPNILPDEAITVLKRLARIRIRYDHVTLFRHFVNQGNVSMEEGWHLLSRLNDLPYAPSRALNGFHMPQDMSLDDMEMVIDQVQSLDEAGHWAAKSFLRLPNQTIETISQGLSMLNSMDEHQRWAMEPVSLIKGATVEIFFKVASFIGTLPDSDARNVRSLFKQPQTTTESALAWLKSYFSLELPRQENRYFSLSDKDKSTLLQAFDDSTGYLVWKINNLHDVTDRHGQEIGTYRLSISSMTRLSELYSRLAPGVRRRFAKPWEQAFRNTDKKTLISILRRATSTARSQAAKDLTSGNIYVLLSRGSELYDSSFRNILVPVLKKRIINGFGDNFLRFLIAVDPDNRHISDFVISLAQKGRLTTFFPKKAAEQEKVLDLVAASAFQDEHSLILFSATFMKLLEMIKPETRSYLIQKMLGFVEHKNTVFTTQLRVILQYYLVEYPDLLAPGDQKAIHAMIAQYGYVELSQLNATAFDEWKRDGRLNALSVFQSDDDGRSSFFSNCRMLIDNGYKPRISASYSLLASDSVLAINSNKAVRSIAAHPKNNLGKLYHLQVQQPIIVDWVKRVNGIEIVHSVFIYQGEMAQQQLLEQFIKKGHEMFAQRGHSYWRKEQLLDPIGKLVQSGSITDQDLLAKQRFMSIGSCGGIRAYSDLNALFKNNVDILATVGTGKSTINDPYNQKFFEIIAESPDTISWKEVATKTLHIFKQGVGEEYLQPGGLPAILHKIMDLKQQKRNI